MARPYSRVVWRGFTSGSIALTGAAPQVADGLAFDTKLAQVGSLSAELQYDVTVSTLTYTASWQVSVDGTNWLTVANGAQNAAGVVFATGTGSKVTSKLVVEAPLCVYAYPYARALVTTGVGVAGGAGSEDVTVLYNYVKSFNGS
jgi:hypothetical protein